MENKDATAKKHIEILIAEDSATQAEHLRYILEKCGFKVWTVVNGKEALEFLNKQQPDIVITDIVMPEIDGYEVCRRLRENVVLKDIPVIFVTALNEVDNETRGFELGAVEYITKPFNPGIVKLRVNNQIELKRQRDLLSRLSMCDGLMGIANRRRFDEYFDQEWKRAIRSLTPLSLLMMDIDFFKFFNDHYGHVEGDNCLKIVAQTLAESLQRPTDIVARYGGEEFVVVLPDTDVSGALFVARRLLDSVNSLCIPHAYSSVAAHLTISCGAATMLPCKDLSKEDLIKQADELLYEAKQAGRNQIRSTPSC